MEKGHYSEVEPVNKLARSIVENEQSTSDDTISQSPEVDLTPEALARFLEHR